MRVVALFVVACGCRMAGAPGIGAAIHHDAGFPERVITDSALWEDVRTVGANADANVDAPSVDQKGDRDGAGTIDAAAGDDRGPDAGNGGGSCHLLATDCLNKQACYPYPFEGTPTGETRCSFPGVGGESTPCQSQLECDGTTLCSAPGQQADSFCLPRCDPRSPRCPFGQSCHDYPSYPGVGVCL